MRRFFIPIPIGESADVTITGADAVHIATVLRMKPGDDLILLDGSGWEYRAQIMDTSKNRVAARIWERRPSAAEPDLHLTVAQALIKDKKMDRLVRRLTELGIRRLIPFTTIRTIPRPSPQRWTARLKRWERISCEAMKQCRRGRLPELTPCISWETLLASLHQYDLAILFWEDARTPLCDIVASHPPHTVRRLLIILGPEGGFDAAEIAASRTQQILTATLGPRILRADTAALAACTLTQYLWGDLG